MMWLQKIKSLMCTIGGYVMLSVELFCLAGLWWWWNIARLWPRFQTWPEFLHRNHRRSETATAKGMWLNLLVVCVVFVRNKLLFKKRNSYLYYLAFITITLRLGLCWLAILCQLIQYVKDWHIVHVNSIYCFWSCQENQVSCQPTEYRISSLLFQKRRQLGYYKSLH